MKEKFKKIRFTFSESGNLYILTLLVISVFSIILSFIPSTIFFGGMSLTNWLGYVFAQISILIVIISFSFYRKTQFLYAFHLKEKPKVRHIFLAPIITVASMIAFLPLATYVKALLTLMGFQGGVAIPLSKEAPPFIVGLIVLCFLPAIIEELLIRGGVLNGLSNKGGIFAIFISALLFSLMHGNPVQTIHQFCLGVILACMTIYSKSIIPSLIVHLTNNILSFSLSVFAPNLLNFPYGNLNYLIFFAMFILGFLALIFLMILFYGKDEEEETSTIEYNDITITLTEKNIKKDNLFIRYIKSIGMLFTKRGWQKIERSLNQNLNDLIPIQKEEGLNVYLAIGITVVWWVIALILGFIHH